MLLAAWASTRPKSASARKNQLAVAGVGPATASSPPSTPEVIVIGNTLARVISSQRETMSIVCSDERFCVRSTSAQLRHTGRCFDEGVLLSAADAMGSSAGRRNLADPHARFARE